MPSIGYKYQGVVVECEVLGKVVDNIYRIRYTVPSSQEEIVDSVPATSLVWPKFSDLVV